jgi:hypothetical protein
VYLYPIGFFGNLYDSPVIIVDVLLLDTMIRLANAIG